jgi:hypothetical protein
VGLFVISVSVTIEVPDVDSIPLTDTNDLRVVARIKDDLAEWISVADEALEEVWHCLADFIIPDFYH